MSYEERDTYGIYREEEAYLERMIQPLRRILDLAPKGA